METEKQARSSFYIMPMGTLKTPFCGMYGKLKVYSSIGPQPEA